MCSPIRHVIFAPTQFVGGIPVFASIDQIVPCRTGAANTFFESLLHVGRLAEALRIISFHRLPFLALVLEARDADIQHLQHLVHTMRCLAQCPAIQNVPIQILENPGEARQQMTRIL